MSRGFPGSSDCGFLEGFVVGWILRKNDVVHEKTTKAYIYLNVCFEHPKNHQFWAKDSQPLFFETFRTSNPHTVLETLL